MCNVEASIWANFVNGYVFITMREATKNFVIEYIILTFFMYDFAGMDVNHLHRTFEVPIMN